MVLERVPLRNEASASPRLRRARLLAKCLGILGLTGCSINDHGLVLVNKVETDTSRSSYFVATGARIETRGPMAGLSLGRVEALHVHIKSCGLLEPRLHYQKTAGIQLVTSSQEFALTLGLREMLVAAPGAPNTASAVRFAPAQPERTTVRVISSQKSNCQPQSQRKELS